MKVREFIPPTAEEIAEAEATLEFTFPEEFIAFIKSGYDLGRIPKDALEIESEFPNRDMYHVREQAREYYGLPNELLPICEDNADYYCLNADGEVVFWSHNGPVDEKWENVTKWRNAMISEMS